MVNFVLSVGRVPFYYFSQQDVLQELGLSDGPQDKSKLFDPVVLSEPDSNDTRRDNISQKNESVTVGNETKSEDEEPRQQEPITPFDEWTKEELEKQHMDR